MATRWFLIDYRYLSISVKVDWTNPELPVEPFTGYSLDFPLMPLFIIHIVSLWVAPFRCFRFAFGRRRELYLSCARLPWNATSITIDTEIFRFRMSRSRYLELWTCVPLVPIMRDSPTLHTSMGYTSVPIFNSALSPPFKSRGA